MSDVGCVLFASFRTYYSDVTLFKQVLWTELLFKKELRTFIYQSLNYVSIYLTIVLDLKSVSN